MGHPTITSLSLGLSVLDRVDASFVPPSFEEGFDKIHSVSSTLSIYTHEEIRNILIAIRASPPPAHDTLQFFRDNSCSGNSIATYPRILGSAEPMEGMRQ